MVGVPHRAGVVVELCLVVKRQLVPGDLEVQVEVDPHDLVRASWCLERGRGVDLVADERTSQAHLSPEAATGCASSTAETLPSHLRFTTRTVAIDDTSPWPITTVTGSVKRGEDQKTPD